MMPAGGAGSHLEELKKLERLSIGVLDREGFLETGEPLPKEL